MSTSPSFPTPPETRADWNLPRPQKMPEPSVWPAALALGIALLLWGLVTSLIITGTGLVLFFTALAGWIRDIRHERSQS